jgi:hypothetical protein
MKPTSKGLLSSGLNLLVKLRTDDANLSSGLNLLVKLRTDDDNLSSESFSKVFISGFHLCIKDRPVYTMPMTLSGKVFCIHILYLVIQIAHPRPTKQANPSWKLTPNLLGSQSEIRSLIDLGYPPPPKPH